MYLEDDTIKSSLYDVAKFEVADGEDQLKDTDGSVVTDSVLQ